MKKAAFEWWLKAYEKQGNLWLEWGTNSPFRAQQGQIHVYKGDFPSNPEKDTKKWTWDNENTGGWDTGLRWGTDWNCAYIAQKSPNGPYTFFIKLTTDHTMGPDVRRAMEAETH